MPCTKNMTGCRTGCLHRQSVDNYRLWRISWEQSLEAYAAGYAAEETEFRTQCPPPTFRDWLEQGAKPSTYQQAAPAA